jgi:hypothetical protein
MKNRDDLLFYTYMLEVINKEIIDEINPTYVKSNKKIKYVLDKCGYKQETGETRANPGSRNYVIEKNVKDFYSYII